MTGPAAAGASRPTPAPAPAASGGGGRPSRGDTTPTTGRRSWRPRLPQLGARPESLGSSVAGVIMGVLVWGWVILPLVRGGPTEVKNTLRAKFFNKDSSGGWLP